MTNRINPDQDGASRDKLVEAWGEKTVEKLFSSNRKEFTITGGAVISGWVTHLDTDAVWVFQGSIEPNTEAGVPLQRVDVIEVRDMGRAV